ncbi:MAG: hydrogenase maturation protease [Verrucomicrobiae bacterium]|nr:hydrogenase maturation protease [Verrucomicrobiae bacterium]
MSTGLDAVMDGALRGRVAVVGLGEVASGDDGAGVRLVRALRRRRRGCRCVEAGTAPERHLCGLGREELDAVLLVDAVDFGGAAGAVGWWGTEEIRARYPQVGTHRLSLGLMARALSGEGRTRVWLLGVQPGSMRRGAGLSGPVARTCGGLLRLLCGVLRD